MDEGYSICLNKWTLDNEIKNELRLLLIISSLTAETGYCFASNKYFSTLFGETEVSISNKIKKLERQNYIEIEYESRGAEITDRRIRLKNILTDDYKIFKSTIKKNFKDKNISINNTSINKRKYIKESFKKPTLEEVQEYCKQRGNSVDPKKFIDFYEVNNWTDSKGNKVKNWKQKVITWEGRRTTKQADVPEWFDKDLTIEKTTTNEIDDILKQIEGD